jgi:Tfp pilus assembly PilM family ATPase
MIQQNIEKAVLKDFAESLLDEISKLIEEYGKEEIMNRIHDKSPNML